MPLAAPSAQGATTRSCSSYCSLPVPHHRASACIRFGRPQARTRCSRVTVQQQAFRLDAAFTLARARTARQATWTSPCCGGVMTVRSCSVPPLVPCVGQSELSPQLPVQSRGAHGCTHTDAERRRRGHPKTRGRALSTRVAEVPVDGASHASRRFARTITQRQDVAVSGQSAMATTRLILPSAQSQAERPARLVVVIQ